MDAFPLQHLLGSRNDAELQRAHAHEVAAVRAGHTSDVVCPACGASGDHLAWFYFSSPRWTWRHLCGRAGVIAFCDRDELQVGSFITMMN